MSRNRKARRMQERLKQAQKPQEKVQSEPSQRENSVASLVLMRNRRQMEGKDVPAQPEDHKPKLNISVARPEIGHPQVPSQNHLNQNHSSDSDPDPVDASNRQKTEIWQSARSNAQYYEEQARQNNCPWYRCPKHSYQYAEFVLITPHMAQELLQSQMLQTGESTNRSVSEAWLDAYKRDILNDRWIPSQEGIAINMSGNLFDGQHRLLAIMEADKPYPMWLTFNTLDEAKFVVDSGKKRSLGEKLSMVVDAKLGNRTAGVCRALMRGILPKDRYSESEVAEFAAKWENLLQWLKENVGKQRVEIQAAVGKAYLWYGEAAIEPFCHRLSTLLFEGEGDPAKALYVAIQRASTNRMNQPGTTYAKTLQAIYAHVEGRTIQRLYRSEQDIFEWQPGWELPEKD